MTSRSIELGGWKPSSAIVLITLRVMNRHHAERDEYIGRTAQRFVLLLLLPLLTAGCHSGDRSVAECEAMLGSDDLKVRVQGANGLSRHGPAAKPALHDERRGREPPPCGCYPRNIPAIDADIKFAIVPASIARNPSFANCPR